MTTNALDFVDWLQSEMDAKGWRQADLARAGGLHTGHLSRVLNRERKPGVEFCQGVARALGMRDVDVMRIAGLAASPTKDEATPSLRELISKFSQLSDEDQEAVLKHVRALDEMQQAEKRRSLRLKPKAG